MSRATATGDRKSANTGEDSLLTYLQGIGRRHLLNAEQEVDLAQRIEAGLFAEEKLTTEPNVSASLREELEQITADGRRAKNHMVEANLRLVVSIATRYTGRGLDLVDVIQQGNLGLIRAVEKFDYTHGNKFSTYAGWWIRQAIQRGLAETARTIRLPVHVIDDLAKLGRAERVMYQELGRDPSLLELAHELEMTPQKITQLQRVQREATSLNAPLEQGGDLLLGDVIEDGDVPDLDDLVHQRALKENLQQMLSALTPRLALIIEMRFGLLDGTPRTLDEVGRRLGLTRERIRQLEKQALDALRQLAADPGDWI